MQETRLAKLEAGLEGRAKVLAWLHVNQQRGGFVELATGRIETNGASVRLPDIEDVEADFVFACWCACNLRVLELQEARLQQGLLFLRVGHFLRADHIPPDERFELQAFRQALKLFVLQGMMRDRVVEIISEEHFSGMRVLYDDPAAMLKKELETAEILLAGFNGKIAPRLGIEPITSEEVEECLLADAPREAEVITSLARAKAELDFGNKLAGYPLIAKVLGGYDSKANFELGIFASQALLEKSPHRSLQSADALSRSAEASYLGLTGHHRQRILARLGIALACYWDRCSDRSNDYLYPIPLNTQFVFSRPDGHSDCHSDSPADCVGPSR